jgi:hypothetical protein
MKRIAAVPALALALLAQGALAQPLPPPVDMPIQNIRQEAEMWCWVAVAQQIILASRGPAATPAQCALVAIANNAPPAVCCSAYNPACDRPGGIPQIQGLIAQFGGHYSIYTQPADAMTLYRTLASGHPVIVQIRTGPNMGHVIVVRGMSFMLTPMGVVPLLHVNDPMQMYTQPVPFAQIAPIWMGAIVIN